MSPSTSWLLFEALLPLFGAATVFLLLGGGNWITTKPPRKDTWAWSEAVDSMGWLYGGTILGVQAAVKGLAGRGGLPEQQLAYGAIAAATVCGLLLASAMHQRGKDAHWKPPSLVLLLTLGLTTIIVFAGYEIQDYESAPPAVASPSHQSEPAKQPSEQSAIPSRSSK
jgi:hypothetical protein